MAVPFQFGALDQFSKAGLSTALEAEAFTRSSGDFLARLQAANAADTAPAIGAPQVRGAGLAGAIGAALTNIVDPGAAERFANAERQVRAQNAQLQAQADLANQQQQGYLQMRRSDREQLMAKLEADMAEVRARAKAKMDELGIMRDTARIDKEAQAQQKQREADAMANSKWLSDHGMGFSQLYMQVAQGMTKDAAGQIVPLDPTERRLLMDDLMTMALTAPTDTLRENLNNRIKALDELFAKEEAAAPSTFPGVGSFGQVDRPLTISEAQAQREASGTSTPKAPGQILGVGRGGILGPLDLDLLTEAVNGTELGGLVSTGIEPTDQGVQNFLGTFNEIYQRRRAEVNQALDQVAPTRRR